MELNRHQYFLLGLVVFLMGLQLRYVDTFVLTERTTQFLAQKMQEAQIATNDPGVAIVAVAGNVKKPVTPPRWLGWSMVSVGAVLVLHSLALKKPAG